MPRRSRKVADGGDETPAARFERLAQQCRIQDLGRLSLLGALVGSIAGLVHALQKERGASSIFLGSGGASFRELRADTAARSEELEAVVREKLAHFDEQLPGANAGTRFYASGARAFRALNALSALRAGIATESLGAQEAIKGFSRVISHLLALSFESADIAADPVTSRAIVALASLSQAKEYAGQERATGGAALSREQMDEPERRRLHYLVDAQERALGVFREFAAPEFIAALEALAAGTDWADVNLMRAAALATDGTRQEVAADGWYRATTRRMDAMKTIEDTMTAGLARLCSQALAESAAAGDEQDAGRDPSGMPAAVPVAMLIADADPEVSGLGLEGGISLYAFEGVLPKPMRSILDVLDAQSRRIGDVSTQLESARLALAERKLIEKAKGLLMKGHRLSENDAYALMRELAMRQNKRLLEVAQAVIGMAERLKD